METPLTTAHAARIQSAQSATAWFCEESPDSAAEALIQAEMLPWLLGRSVCSIDVFGVSEISGMGEGASGVVGISAEAVFGAVGPPLGVTDGTAMGTVFSLTTGLGSLRDTETVERTSPSGEVSVTAPAE